MANWSWPHTPSSNTARLLLAGGPFDGAEAAFLPPNLAAPAQIVWSGWTPGGFAAYLYEWHGEKTTDRGRTDALIFRPTGRRLDPDEMPPVLAEYADVWADGADLIAACFDVPPELLWPGL